MRGGLRNGCKGFDFARARVGRGHRVMKLLESTKEADEEKKKGGWGYV